MEANEIELRCTIELLAKPKDTATDALKKILSNIEENGKKLEARDVEYGEPKKVEQDFFSAFATFKVRSDPTTIFNFILDYAPSTVEVMNGGDVRVSIADLQGILNDISGRLNQMDSNIKMFSAKTVILSKENEELKKTLGNSKNK
jgi:hypothetical protein